MTDKLKKGEFGEFYDSRGRVCTAQGVPLRNASNRKIVDESGVTRTGVGVPFRGKPGKPHRKGARALAARVKLWEDQNGAKGYRSNSYDRHRPGSLQFG